jgi:hypothetical protein
VNFLFSSLRQLNILQIKPIHFNCLTLRYKHKAREHEKKKKKKKKKKRIKKKEKMKRKLDKKRIENLLFSSFRQFIALQIKPLCFNCLTKRLSKHTFVLKNMDTCRNFKHFLRQNSAFIYI